MKLYDVPRETFVKVLEDVQVPPGAKPILAGETIFFDHLDGMYSFCMNEEQTEIFHMAGWTEVEILEEKNAVSRVQE